MHITAELGLLMTFGQFSYQKIFAKTATRKLILGLSVFREN